MILSARHKQKRKLLYSRFIMKLLIFLIQLISVIYLVILLRKY
nr:MAG TPA: hypothetical protein [Caudoviricetes sp.]